MKIVYFFGNGTVSNKLIAQIPGGSVSCHGTGLEEWMISTGA